MIEGNANQCPECGARGKKQVSFQNEASIEVVYTHPDDECDVAQWTTEFFAETKEIDMTSEEVEQL